MRVYSYWKCDKCGSMLRGDLRNCPNCGSGIANDVKYLMPNDPEVQEAIRSGSIYTRNNTNQFTDEKGNVSDIVDEKDYKSGSNWKCLSCGVQNFSDRDTCISCGSPKSNKTYFSSDTRPVKGLAGAEKLYKEYYGHNLDDFKKEWNVEKEKKIYSDPDTKIDSSYEKKEEPVKEKFSFSDRLSNIWNSFFSFIFDNWKVSLIVTLSVFLVGFLVWLFWPVERTASVHSFRWDRAIAVEEFTECHESDWSLPSGAKLEYTRREIHHYDRVFDHYETKERQCSRQVQDGYDTDYRDLGNGQVEVVRTPRYKTEYYTETYQEAVYRDEPVYRTKYYYEIGRWKVDYYLKTNGNDKNPYWYETDLPTVVYSPVYGDDRQNSRYENYYVIIITEAEDISEITTDYNTWISLEPYQKITYKSFRFSQQPLNQITIV